MIIVVIVVVIVVVIIVIIVVIIVVVIVVVVVVVIVIVIIVAAVNIADVVDNLDASRASRQWRPKVAQDFARVRVDDDLAFALVAFRNDPDATKHRLFGHDRFEALIAQLVDDTVDKVLRMQGGA
jgi:hypothetical protein